MDIAKVLDGPLGRLNPRLASGAFGYARKIPFVRRRVDAAYDDLLAGLRDTVKPYRGEFPTHDALPSRPLDRSEILGVMGALRDREDGRWRDGLVSGAVYHGDPGFIAFLDEVVSLHSQVNPLHSDLWPSAAKYEAEIVAMTGAMLGGGPADSAVCGTVTSGGTESILLAMEAYRNDARKRRGIRHPEMVVPVTAHAAFDKAARYFGIKAVRTPVGADYRADVEAAAAAITRNTVVVVGSAPAFPHGTIDPITQLAALAGRRGIGFHTDACLGGFVLPWAERLGYPVPPFDFRVPGVTSMSVDTHKYGYAPKGTSVVLYRSKELRRSQYFTATDWPGGLYFSPTLAGSRPGAVIAACWAAMLSMGEEGYLDATRRILHVGARIRAGIEDIPGLRVLGDPMWVIAFTSDDADIYVILDNMSRRGWNLNGLHRPAALHLAVTLRHTRPGVAERFLGDLAWAAAEAQTGQPGEGGTAPIYGMAATVPVRRLVGDLLERYLDLLYET